MFHEIITSIKLALGNLRSNVGRTILSLLGIVIGVSSVIIVLSMGQGVEDFIIKQVESFGTDIIEIEVKVPKTSKTSTQNIGGIVGGAPITTFTLEDAEAIADIENIGDWYGGIMSQQVVSYKDKNKQAFIMGVSAGVAEADKKAEIEMGRMFNDEEENGLKQLVALGSEVKKTFFGDENAIGKTIKIKGKTFKVVGVMKERGMTGGFNFDNTIYIPIKTIQKKVLGIDYIQFAVFKMKDPNRLELTILEATDVMRRQHDIDDPNDDDFAVNSIVEAKEMLGKVFTSMTILLLALTSISLIVGGVGIMNIMYVVVVERTFEIGLRKSVGAKNSDILKQFLFESIFLTLIGGVIGVLIGVGVSEIAEYFIKGKGFFLQFSLTFQNILIGFGFAAATGIIFGYYPARRASQLSPMEAMRKE